MAQKNAVKGSKLLIMVGNGATPESFVHPCFINTSRNFSISAEVEEYPTYDCDDPEAVVWKQREKTMLSADIEGAGLLYTADMAMFDAWERSENPRNVKIMIDTTAANGGGSWTGAFHLVSITFGTEGPKGTIDCTLSLVSTGEIAPFVAAA